MSRDYETGRLEQGPNEAQIHAEIAKRVYPDAFIGKATSLSNGGEACTVNAYKFDLLETDKRTGKPTKQAKASALDVQFALRLRPQYVSAFTDIEGAKHPDSINMYQEIDNGWRLLVQFANADNPCAAIYEAAKEACDG